MSEITVQYPFYQAEQFRRDKIARLQVQPPPRAVTQTWKRYAIG